MKAQKPVVGVIGTGGTISSLSPDSLDVLNYPDIGKRLDIEQLMEKIPDASRFAELRPLPFKAVSSTRIGPDDWMALARLMMDHADDVDGFVLTHGTASLEECAYFLNLTVKTDKPIVVVGAQRPMSAVSTDASMNFISAVRTAVSPGARGQGVLVVLNDEIHCARDARKASNYRLQTFQSPDFGLLGHVDGDTVAFYRSVDRTHTVNSTFDISNLDSIPRVDILYSYAGSDGAAVDAFIAAGAKGIVSAGFAPGLTTLDERTVLDEARKKGVVVVQSSRAGSGRVAPREYLVQNGIVAADNLSPQKARILLALALTKTQDPIEIQRLFSQY